MTVYVDSVASSRLGPAQPPTIQRSAATTAIPWFPLYVPPPLTWCLSRTNWDVSTFRFVRDRLLDWGLGLVEEAETVLEAMADRTIQQIVALLRQGRGADGRRQNCASDERYYSMPRAAYLHSSLPLGSFRPTHSESRPLCQFSGAQVTFVPA
ncbi:hypothetical protein BC826DRAFT_49280 [Russula brevipes]|nr:hypothetical protein BC826DRAFT_49280 [Russula brevipes]